MIAGLFAQDHSSSCATESLSADAMANDSWNFALTRIADAIAEVKPETFFAA